VTLWLAANLREETVLPAGQTDPTHPAGEPSADFYALASSAKNLQAVLERAISEQDTAVVMRAISALARTAGAENLVAAVEGGAQPLVAALTYPSRQVRFMAAEALVLARPQKPFPGWHLVVPVLIEALRGTGVPVAVLADPDQEHRNKVKDLLRAAGLEVVDGPAFGPALQGARSGAGVDLVVLSSNLSGPDAAGAVGMLRREGAISRVPVILVGRAAQMTAVRDLAKSDPLSQVLAEEQLNAGEVASAVKAAFAKAAGSQPTSAPGGEVQSEDWAIRAADALHGLAERRNPVFDLTDATRSLIAATKDKRDRVRLAAAAALSQFRAGAAQQAIADLAGDDAAGENVRVEAYVSLSESVRLFGNQLTEKQTKAIVDTVMGKGSQAIRDAAAQALGALALPAEKIKELILAAQ
jgi:CheY-like chemotaxis protein